MLERRGAGMRHDRHLRHALIDWFPQARVRAARIAVVGAGAVGNEVVKNLALLGAGAIDVFDFDRVELHNLTRAVFLREADVGAPKASALAARAAEVDPAVRVTAVEGDFWDTLPLAALAGYDCAVAAVDNFEARVRLNRMCRIAGVDFVSAGIDSRLASLEAFPFASNPDCACYECHLPESAYQRIAARYSCGGLRRVAAAERLVPTTAITASVAGALAASAALRLGRDAGDGARRVLFDTIGGGASVAALARRAGCAGCGDLGERPRVLAARAAWRERIAAIADDVAVQTSDPLIVGYACARCGDRSRAGQYVLRRARDFDDRIAICAACGEPAVRIDIRDEFTAAELVRLYPDRPPPAKFAIARAGDGALCLDFETDDQRPQQPQRRPE
ncbi:MAG: ThiF family adenylyltransferase [Burkholderiales bacterium]|nr:ThiF family adenylyltransferase [Burkholderiales bacterium]